MLDWAASAPHQSLYLLERLAGAHCQFGVAKLARRRCGQGVVRAGGRLVLRLRQRLVARAGVHGRAEQSEHRGDQAAVLDAPVRDGAAEQRAHAVAEAVDHAVQRDEERAALLVRARVGVRVRVR